jgi:D-alanyl-D-alanine carboxypeptidase
MKINNLFLLFISLGLSTSLFAQHKLDTYLEHLFVNRKFMGSVAISFNDSIIYTKSVGFANADTKGKINKDTKIRIGSITKTYTAVLVLKAVEEGLIKLDDKLRSFYPQVKNAEKITIEQLLKHQSGIFNFTEILGENQWEQTFHNEEDFIDFFVNEKSNFEPGTDYQYSNTNYALLGFILQKTYGKSFAEILDEKICRPLCLKNTYFSIETDETKNEALSYSIQDNYIQNAKVNFSNHPASGGMVSTAIELNVFLSALFNGKLISEKSLEQMLPQNGGEYGLGIEKLYFKNPEGYTHGGRIENYFSEYWYFPKEKLGIVTLSNAINIYTEDIQTTLLQFAYGKTPEVPNFKRTKDLSEKQFETIAGTYREKEKSYILTISSDGQNAMFQNAESGQMYFPIAYKGNNIFEYEEIKLEFFPATKELRLQQGAIEEHYIKLHE